MVTVIIPPVMFYTSLDKAAFKTWINGIDQKGTMRGSGPHLYIDVEDPVPPWIIAEFLTLYERYRLDYQGLRVLLSSKNRRYFDDPTADWYQALFGPEAGPVKEISAPSDKS